MLKKIISSLSLITFAVVNSFGGSSCGINESHCTVDLATANAGKLVTIGVTAGPHVEVMEFVQRQAKKQGINIKIVEFNDFILPNIALADGDIDLNSYQHEPFLEEQVKQRGYKITSLGKTLLFPIGVYSKKHKRLEDLPQKAQIAIPNDPTNGGRALLLLQHEGLIKLRKNVGHTPSPMDITENPKKLKFIELEAPQIPRALRDVDAAIVNTDWALLAGMEPSKDALAQESKDSPYANIIAARTKDKDNPLYLKIVKIYQSPETAAFVKKRFGDDVIPAW